MEEKTYRQMDCDILVLGAGGAGLAAGARAGSLGKKVLVLDKAKYIGGGAAFAADFKIFNSVWQRKRGIDDRMLESLRSAMDETRWKLDPHLVVNTYLATGAFFDWVCQAFPGMEDDYEEGQYIFDRPNGPIVPVLKNGEGGGPGAVRGGKYMVDRLTALCARYGVPILLQHRAVDVEMADGRVAAVWAESPEGRLRIACRACIVTTGSWINNQEILEKYEPAFARVKMGPSPHRNPNYTGDGIALAEKAGAKVDYESFCLRLMGPMVMSRSQTVSAMANHPLQINVNKNGERWACEPAQVNMGIFQAGHVLLDQPEGESWIVFDAGILEQAAQRPVELPAGFPGPPGVQALAADPAADLAAAAQESPKQVLIAESLEALAESIGALPQALADTVSHYNRYCETKLDCDCFKAPENLVPFTGGPYYAIRGELATDGAFGGILVNSRMEAYAKSGEEVVPGLYCAGDFASGRFINLQGFKKQIINDLAWAFASGFIAGENAAKSL